MTTLVRSVLARARRHIAACCTLAAAISPALADTITLRPVVRVDAATSRITLGDIATLDGPTAAALAPTPILELTRDAGTWTPIDVARVREALKARTDLDWSALTIHGLCTQVRRLDPPKPAPDAAPAEPEPESATPTEPNVRLAIAQRLTDMLAVDPDHIRLRIEDRDQKGLSTSTIGRIVDIQPLGSGDRIPLAVRVYEGESLVLNTTLRVQAEVLRRVAVATGSLRRGQPLEASDFIIEERWLGPTDRPIDPDAISGKTVRQRVNPGQVIGLDDLQPPVVVRRGELVMVHCINAGFVVKVTARALTDGREAEIIQFETLEPDRRERRVLVARMAGPGTAIASALDTQADPTHAVSTRESRTK